MRIETVAKQIQSFRKAKGLTQNELAERLGITFQAVSKWEREEALPDITLLPDLSDIKNSFSHSHWIDTVTSFAHKYGIK